MKIALAFHVGQTFNGPLNRVSVQRKLTFLARTSRAAAAGVLSGALSRIPVLRPVVAFWFVFGIAFAMRITVMLALRRWFPDIRFETLKVARSIVSTGVFGSPWRVPTGPTSEYAPFQPYLVAVVYWIFGLGPAGEFARHVLGCIASALTCGMLPGIAARLGFTRPVGLLAGVIGALLPLKYNTETSGAWDAPWAAAILMVATAECFAFLQNPKYGTQRAILKGALWGTALLVSPALLPVLAGFTLLELVRLFPHARTNYLKVLTLQTIVMVLVLTPWTVRNYRTFGVLCPVRCGFGLELYTSNSPRAHFSESDNFRPGTEHPTFNVHECSRIIAMGEPAYFRMKLDSSWDWIRSNPVRFAEFTGLHFVTFWFQWNDVFPPLSVISVSITIAAIAGMIRLYGLNRPAFAILLSIWITYPLIFYILQFSTKYRFPIDWTFLLLCSYWIFSLPRKDSTRITTLADGGPMSTA